MFGMRAGIIAAALITLSPLSVYWARDATAYAIEIMLITAGLVFLLRALEHPSAGNLAIWALCNALAVTMHTHAIFAIPAELMPLLMLDWREVPWRRLLTAAAVTVGAAAPLLWLIAHDDHGQGAWIIPVNWVVLGQTLFGLANGMWLYSEPSAQMVVAAYGLAIALGFVATVRGWERSRAEAMPFVLAASGG
jgi:uncharacterized membrane protein